MTKEEHAKGRVIIDNMMAHSNDPNWSIPSDDWIYLSKIRWSETYYVIPPEYFNKKQNN